MIRFKSLFALAALVLAAPSASWAQAALGASTAETEVARLEVSGGFEGKISNHLGQPLTGVLVSVFGASLRGGGITALTDAFGNFRLPQLPPGLYVLHAYLSGFLPTRSTQIEVKENGVPPLPVSLSLMPSGEPGPAVASASDDGKEVSETDERLRELKWLVRHSRRNILRDQQPILVTAEEPVREATPGVFVDAGVDITGEVGVQSGLAGVPGAGAGLDARLAYARLDIPTGLASRWLVNAQLMESVLSSWAASADFVTQERPGQELRAGVAYGNYLYGNLDEFRPPEAGLQRRNEGDRTTEWFGSAYGQHRLKMGPTELETGLIYQHYSYLARSNYLAPRVELAWSPSARAGTVRGSLNYTVNAPGGEDLGLLTRMVTADVAGLPVDSPRALRAERTLRYQLDFERELGKLGAVEVRFFQENADDQLLKTYFRESSRPGPGGYLLANSGDFRTRGLGLQVSRRFGAVAGSVGYTYGRGRALDVARGGTVEPGDEEEIHDLTTTVETAFDRTGTRLYAVYKLTSHLAGTDENDRSALGSRFNVQVHQALPFLGWSGTEWEVLLAVRNLFYQDLAGASLLDEIFVVDSPRRVVGGLAVKF